MCVLCSLSFPLSIYPSSTLFQLCFITRITSITKKKTTIKDFALIPLWCCFPQSRGGRTSGISLPSGTSSLSQTLTTTIQHLNFAASTSLSTHSHARACFSIQKSNTHLNCTMTQIPRVCMQNAVSHYIYRILIQSYQ